MIAYEIKSSIDIRGHAMVQCLTDLKTAQGAHFDLVADLKRIKATARHKVSDVDYRYAETCLPFIESATKNEANARRAAEQMAAIEAANNKPKYEKKLVKELVDYADYRLHILNYPLCQACDEKLSPDWESSECTTCDPAMQAHIKKKRILKALDKAGYKVTGTNSDIIEKLFVSNGQNMISLNLKPGRKVYEKSDLYKIQQELQYGFGVYGKVRPMFGSEIYKTKEVYTEVQ